MWAFLRRSVSYSILFNLSSAGSISWSTTPGVWFRKPFLEISDSEWDLVLTTNLKGTFLCTQQAARIMMPQKSGCVINIASHAGLFYSRGQGAHYAASKAGIIQLTRVLAFELGPFQIRTNAIAPGESIPPRPPSSRKLRFIAETLMKVEARGPTLSAGGENLRILPMRLFFWHRQWQLS